MKTKSVRFKIKIDSNDLFKFNIYHNYWRGGGKTTLAFSILMLILFPVALFVYKSESMMLISGITCLFYLGIIPLQLFLKAKKSYIEVKFYHDVIRYEITENQLVIRQEKNIAEVNLNEIKQTVSTKNYFFIYITNIRSLIIPKRFLKAEELNVVTELIAQLKNEDKSAKNKFSFLKGNSNTEVLATHSLEESLDESMEEIIQEIHDPIAADVSDQNAYLKELEEEIENEVYVKLEHEIDEIQKTEIHPIQKSIHQEGLDYETFGKETNSEAMTLFEMEEEAAQEDDKEVNLPILNVRTNKKKKKKGRR